MGCDCGIEATDTFVKERRWENGFNVYVQKLKGSTTKPQSHTLVTEADIPKSKR